MRFGIIVLVCLVASPGLGHADDAEQWLGDGVALRRQGKDEAAMELFRRSYAARPTAKALAQIALAEQALGRWVDADRDLSQALASADDAWVQRNRSFLLNAQNVIAAHLGQIDVIGPAGAHILLNGQLVGVLPLSAPVRVRAGRIYLEVRLAGRASTMREVDVLGGQLAREVVDLAPITSPTRGSTASPGSAATTGTQLPPNRDPANFTRRNESRRKEIAGITVASTGVSLIGAGVAFGVLAQQNSDELTRAAETMRVFDYDKQQAGKTDQILAGVLLGVGGAALVTGTVLGVLGLRESRLRRVSLGLTPPRGVSPGVATLRFVF